VAVERPVNHQRHPAAAGEHDLDELVHDVVHHAGLGRVGHRRQPVGVQVRSRRVEVALLDREHLRPLPAGGLPAGVDAADHGRLAGAGRHQVERLGLPSGQVPLEQGAGPVPA